MFKEEQFGFPKVDLEDLAKQRQEKLALLAYEAEAKKREFEISTTSS